MHSFFTHQLLNLFNRPPWGIPFPAPALSSEGGTMKRYLATDVMKWEEECQQKKQLKKAI
ncbi:hypothetical protein [Acinetobacter nosocomialis]|uniref:hypothetical protein n=1 Tax=Acinetobacter nosocomialis TaxID=106654 RepID=UPI00313AABB9